MQFVLYTDKTIAQSLTALNARMHAKATSTRPALDGWVEKNGSFSIGVTSDVAGRFSRTTFLRGRLERQNNATVIKGAVSRGATKENKVIIYAVLAVMGIALVGMGSPWMGVLLVPLGAALYIPLTGDFNNSELLIGELEKTLKAKPTPPKATTTKASGGKTAKKTTPARAAAPAPAPSAKPRPTPRPAGDDDANTITDEPEVTRVPFDD